jgi:hypothetical protein
MEALYDIKSQSQYQPSSIKHRQYLVAAAYTNILENRIQEREQAQRQLEELTKQVIKNIRNLKTNIA